LGDAAFDRSDDSIEKRRAGGAGLPWQVAKSVIALAREKVGQVFLRFAQKIDGEYTGGIECVEVIAGVRYRHHHERRFERKRDERIHGHADGNASEVDSG